MENFHICLCYAKRKTMTNNDINEKIATILGFKKYGITVNGIENADFGWIYPDKYRDQMCEDPEHGIPDFISAIDSAITVGKTLYSKATLKKSFA